MADDERMLKGSRLSQGGVSVTVGGQPLPRSLHLRNHSPDGFEWGYGGSGPSQLALSMLLACTDEAEALSAYQDFKRACVSRIESASWEVPTSSVTAWLERRRSDGNNDHEHLAVTEPAAPVDA